MKPDFDKAQNAATKLLLKQDISSLFIDVRNFHLPEAVYIESMQNFCNITDFPISELNSRHINGACLLKQGKARIVLYDDSIINESRKHWGIAHELGHVFLNHTSDNRESEIEAHFFAAQLIAPEIILWELCKRKGSLSDYDLPLYFNLSYEAATKRIATLRRRARYNYADIDKQLLQKFTPVINREFQQICAS